MPDIVNLPENFIGKEDEQRLESFGAHLISHGRATRWHWNRQRGIDVAFEIFTGGPHERLLVAIVRDREHDRFAAKDGRGRIIAEGSLDHVMALLDKHSASAGGDEPA